MVHFIKKRLQVFVSSTYLDLRDERQSAVKAILEAGHIPAGMELFTSGDESQMEVIKQWIEDSDVYLLILGGRYGSIESDSGKSYTHLEYEYATELGKSMFTCVMTNEYLNSKIHGSNYKEIMEQSNIDGFNKFKKLAMSNMVSQCHDTSEMKYQIMRKMNEIALNDSLTGWIRASESCNSALLSEEIARLSQENYQLRDRIESLIKTESQISNVMINGISFDEICLILKKVILSEEDFSTRERIPMIEIIDIPITSASSYNSFVNDALKEVNSGKMKNILDLLIFLSRDILAERGSMNFEILEITSIHKMRILFDIDILEYFESSKNVLYRNVRFTDSGKLFIKITRTQEILKK